MKNNFDIKMLERSYPLKKPIFDYHFQYAIVQKISDYWTDGHHLYLETTLSNFQKAVLKIRVSNDNIINIKYYQKLIEKDRFDYHLNNKIKWQTINFIDENNEIKINLNNDEQLIINKLSGHIKLLDNELNIKFNLNNREGYQLFGGYSSPYLGWKIINESKWDPFISFWLDNDEKIYGLGEKFRPFLKNGIESVIWNSDCSTISNHDLAYNGLPLIYSTKNWGLLVNTGHMTTFEIGSPVTDSLAISSDESLLDLYFFTGKSMKELISQYTLLTGRITGVCDLAYGIWMNRLYYHNREELFVEVSNTKKYLYPLDVITLDPKWLNNRYVKSCNFEINEGAFGNFKTLITDLKKADLNLCLWINPYLQNDNQETWKDAFKNNYLLKTITGDYAHPFTGTETYQDNNHIVDFTNKMAFQWYKNKVKELLKMGVRFVKPDYGDGVPYDALFSNHYSGLAMKQYYLYLYCQAVYEASQEIYGEDQALIFARPGYIGSQKFVGKWSGDCGTNFSDLKIHLQAGLSLSLAGEVMWSTDIGGFNGPKPSDELYIRWTQLGMLTPMSRYHGTTPREPWYYSDQTLNIATNFAHLKRSLLPYYKQYELEAIETGIPIMRPMVLENPNDVIAQKVDDQFYLGENILVAPILNDKKRSRQVYLPAGEWYLFNKKDKAYLGGKLYNFKCSLDETLIFIKNGSVIVKIKEKGYKFTQLNKITLLLDVYGSEGVGTIKFKIDNQLHQLNYDLRDKVINFKSSLKYEIMW